MVQLEIYKKYYNITTVDELVNKFQNTLTATNRSPQFFVDWEKVKKNADRIKIELSLWNSLIGSNDIESDFIQLITNYPEVIKTIPILLAIREREFPIIIDFFNIKKGTKTLNFKKKRFSKISSSEVNDYVSFVKNAGMFELFTYIKNFYDYILGVEVGMDTNARKNRSGQAMERLLQPIIQNISNKLGLKVLSQKKFNSIKLYGGYKIPTELSNRKSDFIIISGTKCVNIEVNYYSGAGSKPEEIVDSYINRKNELKTNDWVFIWITDGNVWKGSESQLAKAFREMDYVMNLEFVNAGLLQEALLHIFQ